MKNDFNKALRKVFVTFYANTSTSLGNMEKCEVDIQTKSWELGKLTKYLKSKHKNVDIWYDTTFGLLRRTYSIKNGS